MDDEEKIASRINIKGNITTSQQEIAAKYMDHIQNKINNLTQEKPKKSKDAMKIFTKLIERVHKTFDFQEVRYH